MQQTHPARGQIGDHFGARTVDLCIVDHVHIGFHARRQNAPVIQIVQSGGGAGLAFDDFFDRNGWAGAAITGPVAEHEGRHGGIANRPTMRPGIRSGRNHRRVVHQFVQEIQVVIAIVDQDDIDEALAVVFHHHVVQHGFFGNSGRLGQFLHARFARWFIVQPAIRLFQPEHHVIAQRGPFKRQLVGLFRQDRRANGRIAHLFDLLCKRQCGDRIIRRAAHEHVKAALQPHDNAGRAHADLRIQHRAIGLFLARHFDDAAPFVGIARVLEQQIGELDILAARHF